MKIFNLRHYRPAHRNNGLSEYQRRASQQRTSPSPARSREARGKLNPRDGIFYQTASRLPVANQVFLGSWMVDIHQEGCSQRSAPQRRHTAHLRWCPTAHPGNLSDWDQGIDKICPPPGESALTSTWLLELLEPGKDTKRRPNQVCAFVEHLTT